MSGYKKVPAVTRLVTGYYKDGGVEFRVLDIQDSNVYNHLVC